MDKTLEVKLIDIEREITMHLATFKTKTSNPTKNIPTESRIKESQKISQKIRQV